MNRHSTPVSSKVEKDRDVNPARNGQSPGAGPKVWGRGICQALFHKPLMLFHVLTITILLPWGSVLVHPKDMV